MTTGTSTPALRIDATAALAHGGIALERLREARERGRAIRSALLREPGADVAQQLVNGAHAQRVLECPRAALADYRANRRSSEVSRILAAAGRLRENVDRVVVVASAATLAAIQSLASACSHPYHNELSRGARGGRPRVYFAGGSLDNDALHGLLDLLEGERAAVGAENSWGLIAIDSGEDALEPLAVSEILVPRLRAACGDDERVLGERLLLVSPAGTRLDAWARTLPGPERFAQPDGLPGAWSLLTTAVLLPAAVLGIDIVRFLAGGTEATTGFCSAKTDANPALELAALRNAWAVQGASRRALSTPLHALRGFQCWHDAWLAPLLRSPSGAAGSVDSDEQGLEIAVERGRRDRLWVGHPAEDRQRLGLPDATDLADLARCEEVRDPQFAATNPSSIRLQLPDLEEATLGQFAQTLLLATVVERQLGGFNSGA